MVHVDGAAADVDPVDALLAEHANAGHHGGCAGRRQGLQKRTSISHRVCLSRCGTMGHMSGLPLLTEGLALRVFELIHGRVTP